MLYAITKRFMDLALALTGLVILAPVLAAAAIAIRFSMGAPVLFRQVRPGHRARPFTVVKFRTMRDAHSPDGRPLPDAARLTWLGRLLRWTSVDELPQLWNVLRGEMSLVGPRPLLPEYLPLYSPLQARRHEVKPGVTGWAQVRGRNALSWQEKFELDVWYVDNRRFTLDVWIIALTIYKALKREGISQAGHATAPCFTGNADPGE